MRNYILIAILVVPASLFTFARTVSVQVCTDLRSKTFKSHVVVHAICMDKPQPGEFVYLNRVRDVWKEVKWEYDYVNEYFVSSQTEEQIHEYRKELSALQSKMEAVTNFYACAALWWELKRHQREYRIPFKVEEVFKGYVKTNELYVCYSSENLSETNSSFFKAGQKYFLFLEDKYADQGSYLSGENFFSLNEVWNPEFHQCTPASTNYMELDTWKTYDDPKLMTLRPRAQTVEHKGLRSLNHTQYVERIKNLVQEQNNERARIGPKTEEDDR
jgi:hypothetical protein